jgi:hypothetical protein
MATKQSINTVRLKAALWLPGEFCDAILLIVVDMTLFPRKDNP